MPLKDGCNDDGTDQVGRSLAKLARPAGQIIGEEEPVSIVDAQLFGCFEERGVVQIIQLVADRTCQRSTPTVMLRLINCEMLIT